MTIADGPDTASPDTLPWRRRLASALWVFIGIETLWFARYGGINPDEGYLLYAAQAVSRGQMPYAEFAFPQMPLAPMTLGIWYAFVGSGVLAGRLACWLLALASVAVVGIVGERLRWPRWLAPVAVLASPWLLFPLVQARVYVFANLLIALAVLVGLSKGPWRAGASSILVIGASLARLSAFGVGILLVGYWCLVGPRERRQAMAVLAGTVACGLIVLALPFRESLLYHVLHFHASRDVGFAGSIVGRASYLAVTLGREALLMTLTVIATGIVSLRQGNPSSERLAQRLRQAVDTPPALIAVLALGGIFAHLPANVTGLDASYVCIVATPLMLLAGWALSECIKRGRHEVAIVLAICGGAVNLGALAPHGAKALAESPLDTVRRAAAVITSETQPDEMILTPNTILLAETGRRSLPGYEGCFYHPFHDTEWTTRRNVVSHERLLEDLREARPAMVALKPTALQWGYPSFHRAPKARQGEAWTALERRYEAIESIEGFGQWGDTLTLYKRKP